MNHSPIRVIAAAVCAVMLSASLTGCLWHKDTTKAACQSMKDKSFDSVIGPLYDHASPSFKHEYDKVDSDSSAGLDYFYDLQRLTALCAQHGVKNAGSSMELP